MFYVLCFMFYVLCFMFYVLLEIGVLELGTRLMLQGGGGGLGDPNFLCHKF